MPPGILGHGLCWGRALCKEYVFWVQMDNIGILLSDRNRGTWGHTWGIPLRIDN